MPPTPSTAIAALRAQSGRLALLALLAPLPLLGAQAPWTQEQLADDLDEIAAAVRDKWSYFDDHRKHFGVDVDSLLERAKAELPGVRSIDDFARILRRFAAGLQDGHAWSHVPGESPPPSRRLPFLLADCEDGLVVRAVADFSGDMPKVGDLLLAIDGAEAAACVAAAEAEVFGSTPGQRRALALDRLGCTAERLTCTFAGPTGIRHTVELPTVDGGMALGPPQPANWSLAWPRPGVAVLHLHSFAVPRWQEWLQAKPEEREPFLAEGKARIEAIVAELEQRQAQGLVIDLRGNGGGTDALGIHLAERLLGRPFVYFQLSAQDDEGGWRLPGGITYGQGDHARYSGPLALLVDGRSFSTTDNFARCLDDLHPECTIVGRPSGGGTGAPRALVTATHSKAVVGACTMRVLGPKGRLTEGRGTVPDVAVRWTRADVLAGRDPDLEAALAAVGK